DVDTLAGQELPGLLHAIDPRRLDADGLEARRRELGPILGFFQRARDAAHPQKDVPPQRLGDGAARNHIRYGEAAARLQDAERLAQDLVLVARQIDDAVGDDDVDRVVGQRNVLDLALQELHVLDARLLLVLAGQRQHLVGHVEAVGLAAWTD